MFVVRLNKNVHLQSNLVHTLDLIYLFGSGKQYWYISVIKYVAPRYNSLETGYKRCTTVCAGPAIEQTGSERTSGEQSGRCPGPRPGRALARHTQRVEHLRRRRGWRRRVGGLISLFKITLLQLKTFVEFILFLKVHQEYSLWRNSFQVLHQTLFCGFVSRKMGV